MNCDLGPISQTDLSLVSYHFVLDLSPKTDLSLLVKLAPALNLYIKGLGSYL